MPYAIDFQSAYDAILRDVERHYADVSVDAYAALLPNTHYDA